MKRYETYKDSGVQWLGEIPTHWKVCRVKSIFSHVSGNGFKLMYQGKQEGKYPFCKASDINGSEIFVSSANNYVDDDVAKAEGYNIIPKYSILFSKIGEALKKNHRKINTVPCIVDNNCSALVNHSTENIIYYYYVMRNVDMIWFDNGGVIPCVNVNKLMAFGLPLPPKEEQEAIVAFLDEKTAEIDGLVSQVEREIELLKEYKQAEIARVVTHGLNPNAPMKPSGISWIGDIPEHWATRKMKFTFTERSEKNHPDEPVLCATQSQGVIPQSMYDNRVVVVNKGFENLKFVKVGDFVISLRSFQGGIEYAHYQGIISAAYTVLTPNKAIDPGYARLLMKSHDFIQLLKTCVTGIREGQNINYDLLKNKFIPIPPLNEQQEIVDYIDRKTTEIDRLVVELTYQVEYLKEYKQRLIADVVTGKINVQPN